MWERKQQIWQKHTSTHVKISANKTVNIEKMTLINFPAKNET